MTSKQAFDGVMPGDTRPASKAPTEGDWSFTAVYGLGFLTLISTFNYLDRSLLGLALPQIKAEMHLSDTVMGLVSGLAFVLFYSIMGVPIAWVSDRWNRRNIIAAGFAFWSLMTLMTGWVTNIWQLTIARFLMGAGEACGIAPSNSMTADLFRAERRPLVYSIFAMAASISSIVFFPIAGWVGQHYGWRQMFMVIGTPGIFLALIFLLTVREPRRGASEGSLRTMPAGAGRDSSHPPFWRSVGVLLRSRAYLALLAGGTLMGLNLFASAVWTPTFLSRVHGLSLSEIAATIGPIRGFCGIIGVLLGGLVIDRLGRRAAHWRMTIPAIACALVGPAEAVFALSDAHWLWLGAFAVSGFLLLIHQGPVFAGVMAVADVRMRAVATSVLLFCSAMFGQAVGPLAVGMMNDLLEPSLGDQAIRYSMLMISGTAIFAGLVFWLAGRFIASDSRKFEGVSN
ncbi:MAG: MFS transporter [Candidatus Andeanibacterium colombiense]|uniref:MFS transporter n=1 Tax=Candidatus Andeanibacterium colombiense TaxID=3121345 RepID=A0AAJ5X5N7_9SPHN|nr:MAG: MFS transporter [Sphingomonadaceae bacterium]